MTSAERVTAALESADVDYTPCSQLFWRWGPTPREQFQWKDDEERLKFVVGELGLDEVLLLPLFGVNWEAPERSWVEHVRGERWPILHSEVDTPRGPLHASIKKTEDYELDQVHFFSDWAVSRFVEPWIQSMEDVEKFASIFQPPDDELAARQKAELQDQQKLAEKWQLAIVGVGNCALNVMQWLMGAQQALFMSMDHPEVIDTLIEVLLSAWRKKLETYLSWGLRIVIRNAWGSTTEIWTPDQVKRWVVPQIQQEAATVHGVGGMIGLRSWTGLRTMLGILDCMDVDFIHGPDPVLDKIGPATVRAAVPGKCIWGGVSAQMHIGEGTPETVRRAVRDAFSAFGNKGFILEAVPFIRAHRPWKNVLAMIEEWKRLRRG